MPVTTTKPPKILLGVAGSHRSALAVRALARRAWPVATKVLVVPALDVRFWAKMVSHGEAARAWHGHGGDDVHAWAGGAVGAIADELQAAGLAATGIVAEGEPKLMLEQEAERLDADCIFVGAASRRTVSEA